MPSKNDSFCYYFIVGKLTSRDISDKEQLEHFFHTQEKQKL